MSGAAAGRTAAEYATAAGFQPGRTSRSPEPGSPGCPAAGAAAGPAAGPRTPASRSSLVIRPFGPLPDTMLRSRPSSRASRRTPGPACRPVKSAGRAAPAAVTCAAGGARRFRGAPGGFLRRGDGIGGRQGWRLLLIGQCWRLGNSAVGVQQQNERALLDPVADLHPELADRAGRGRGNVHGRLVRFQRDQRILLADHIAVRDMDLDDRHVGEVTEVRNVDFSCTGHGCSPGPRVRGRSRLAGRAGSWSYPGRIWLVRVDPVSRDRVSDLGRRHRPVLGERGQRGHARRNAGRPRRSGAGSGGSPSGRSHRCPVPGSAAARRGGSGRRTT